MSIKSVTYNSAHVFDPAASVFVSANAGTGKTSLLTNRVLALLLHGIDPSKLLCLTYTHAAASEMSTRILEKLGAWVMASDAALEAQISALTGELPTSQRLFFARSLFAKVLEVPDGLRIQTIHSFCQSLLRRFPLEAGVSPHFTLMDSRTEQELLKEACLRLFSQAQSADPTLQASLNAIAHRLSESSFHSLLSEIIKNKRRIRSLFAKKEGVRYAENKIKELLKIPKGSTVPALAQKYFSYDDATKQTLRTLCAQILNSPLKTDPDTGMGLATWLEKGNASDAVLENYIAVYTTTEGAKRKRLYTQKALTESVDQEALLAEQERVYNFCNERKALETAERTGHILHLAEAVLALYDKLKNNHALIDYDDLILTARSLLQKPDIAPWVLYKLDGGIEHVLVDEAQDTSPEQWDIIEALTQEFFAGFGAKEQHRSIFVVGDEKQSIYSFQGAAPRALALKEQFFSARIRDAAKPLHKIQLTHSFRSTSEILTAVDSIFSQSAAKEGLMFGTNTLEHIPTRLDHPGLVELWPLTEPVLEGEEIKLSAKTQLARQIADTVRGWLDNGLWLESKGRCVEPGDIMILIRKRTVLVNYLVRALKRKNIPVAGHDRMALGENLAVQDLIALGQCLLLPEDDLTLAASLKSPIFALSEETLFMLCSARDKKSVWERLREQNNRSIELADAYRLLGDLRAKADYISPYELYSYLLDTRGARKRFIGRMGEEYQDAIDEFLGQALLYERSHTPSLQGFLHWLVTGDSEIKRDMEQAKGSIRIMTVHGAKGLQAPIVLLPDTVDVPRIKDTLVWYDSMDGGLPFWPGSKMKDFFTADLLERQRQDMLAEYRRLLYVALTRAEDRLYIAGFRTQNSVNEQSWYHLIENGLKPLASTLNSGQGLRYGHAPIFKSRVAIPENIHVGQGIVENDFSFLNTPAPIDPIPSQPLVPSHLSLDEPAALSPLSSKNVNLFQRGNFIHHLLQYLPKIATNDRKKAAYQLASTYRQAVSDSLIKECVAEVLCIIDDPKSAFLFPADALTEVPVAGCVMLGGKSVSVAGQIDRLCIGADTVWIVDYKSNRLRPETVSQIPVSYGKQLALYQKLLKQIYPHKAVRCALLWTTDATITLLDEALLSTYI